MRGYAGLEQGGDILRRPAAHACMHVVGKRRRIPVQHRDHAARQCLRRARGAQGVARRVARGAMTQAFDQISATVPLYRLARIRFLHARLEVQRTPRRLQRPLVVRKVHLGRPVGLPDGRDAAQIGEQGVGVAARDARVFGVRKGRIQQRAVPGLAVMQRLPEIVGRPGADAGVRVRRDVRSVHRAERRGNGSAARQCLAAPAGVAGHAVACQRQVTSAFDQTRAVRRSPGWTGAGVFSCAQPIQTAQNDKRRQQ